MKLKVLLILTLSVFLTNCGKTSKIRLKDLSDAKYIIYDRAKAKFYLPANDFVKYCKAQDTVARNNFALKDVLRYIASCNGNQIVITDSVGRELVKKHLLKGDTLVYERNSANINAYVLDAVQEILVEFAKEGNLKVFDKVNKLFVDYIFLEVIDTKAYGTTSILLPNKSKVYSRLDHIQ